MTFYIIEQSYEGPNPDDHLDDQTFRVQTRPGLGNLSHKPILHGWLGTTNDWCKIAHGEFATLDEAKAEIDRLTANSYREDELEAEDRYNKILYRVRVGRLEPWNAAASQDWCWESMRDRIDVVTTDDEILDWSEECANDAASENFLLDLDAVVRMATSYRDELADKDDEESA